MCANTNSRGYVPNQRSLTRTDSTSYDLGPIVLISAMRHSLQRSLQNICRIYLRGGSTELFRRTPRKIKFLVFQPSDSNPRFKMSGLHPVVKPSGGQPSPRKISAIYCQETATTGPYGQKFGGIALHIRFPLLGFISLTIFLVKEVKEIIKTLTLVDTKIFLKFYISLIYKI